MKTWANFEDNVRDLASAIWGKHCEPKHVGGVDIDGVIELDADICILVEITERRDLAKVREDVHKLLTARNALLAQSGKYARCYCIINGSVTNSMVEAGQPHSINVLPFETFSRLFFDFGKYFAARNGAAFGSAVNPLTGKKDDSSYVSVRYLNESNNREIDIDGISKLIKEGKRIVLIGEYGTGKSRCIREVFRSMGESAISDQYYPVAIDLREAWGVKRGPELLRRHLEDLGADDLQSSLLRALRTDTLALLFDGFDELGSQAWSNDSTKLKAIRAKSLEGVKDLILKSSGGLLISGREHYFNNNEEMFSALGLQARTTVVLRCKAEFSETETADFFKRLQTEIAVPDWLPRRPLICQTIADLDADDLDRMFGSGEDEIEFWDHFIRVLCERDARIHASFDAETIEKVLIYLARLTRSRLGNVGPITLADAQKAFEEVVGEMPVEDAAIMLQRLPALGRVKAESNDRQFIDNYILDGLRARDAINAAKADETIRRSLASGGYINPIDDLGQRILANKMKGKEADFYEMAKRCVSTRNVVLGCDIIASLLRTNSQTFDFKGLIISDGHFIRFDMRDTIPIALTITDSVFGSIYLPSSPPPKTEISNCLAERVFGVASANALPSWIQQLNADLFDSIDSVSRIRKIGLDPKHEILVTIVRKTFFQKGTGRKEEALLRGLGRIASASEADQIVNLLLREKILSRFKGDEGWVYAPDRQYAGRMQKMLYELKVSEDPIWKAVATL